ncbi:histidine kinase [Aureibaculum sp. A20]|uniref:Histidine kinase n=1 Tax=Aureibaculum flavum TaxID=2795986 RepID=A0ABS0WQ20_9FLAO|nr:histidine kinase [Aureibaculum flavum]MBJ2173973.1 histidine kinase [Aureibaculum flavum]
MLDSIKQLFEYPHQNGFTTFVLGVLFVLFVYHFLLYFQNKDKVYLYYSLYTFLIFLNQTKFVLADSDSMLISNYKSALNDFHTPIIWAYNTIYFVFGFSFLNLKKYSVKWHTFIFNTIYILFAIILITVTLFLITKNSAYIFEVSYYLIPSLFLLGIVGYYVLFTVKMPLNGYIIIGSLVLYVTSFIGRNYFDFDAFSNNNAANSVFYIGVIIENIIFSLGLGHKQKLILEDKNDSQEKLINQLQENEFLRETVQNQLKQDLALLKEKSKNEKLVTLKETADKELAELKITSLRSQMNPHFIFNSLNAIKLYIINNEKENAVYYLNKFSKLIRRILNASQDKETSLEDEIETTSLYVNIENMRFNNEIDYELTIDKSLNLNATKIPSLILQPFMENALWHGLSAKKGNKKLTLDIKKNGKGNLIFTIEDNGIGRGKSAEIKGNKVHKRESIGLKLTEERLRNFVKDNSRDYKLTFEDLYNEDGVASGTKVILKLYY